MHDLKYLTENQGVVRENLSKRNIDLNIFDKVLELDHKRKGLIRFGGWEAF